ncbi:MAG: hypothetical protein OXU23_03375 [Candidatus Poribacteria bacterium]|nr:hypothetical protein [Candidatus Poribacteria bacterium]
MEYDVKPITELPLQEIKLGKSEHLGKSFLLELNEHDEEIINLLDFVDDIVNKFSRDLNEEDVRRNLSEAVQWLCNKGLLAEYKKHTQGVEYFITRLGHKYLKPGTTMMIN